MTIERSWRDPRCTREGWSEGPWDGEPDKVQWQDEATGLACLAKRNSHMGNWCGYVGVPEGHPWHRKDYNGLDVSVHGGLTFADSCQEGPPESTICHIPEPGEPDALWWLGFDCAHGWDMQPGMAAFCREHLPKSTAHLFTHEGTYKSLQYVRAECAKLATQVKAAA